MMRVNIMIVFVSEVAFYCRKNVPIYNSEGGFWDQIESSL